MAEAEGTTADVETGMHETMMETNNTSDASNHTMDDEKYDGGYEDDEMSGDGMRYKISMDGMEFEMEQSEAYGGDQLTTEMKFDQYFMNGLDNLNAKGNNAPPCGPGETACSDMFEQSCCTHVIMTD